MARDVGAVARQRHTINSLRAITPPHNSPGPYARSGHFFYIKSNAHDVTRARLRLIVMNFNLSVRDSIHDSVQSILALNLAPDSSGRALMLFDFIAPARGTMRTVHTDFPFLFLECFPSICHGRIIFSSRMATLWGRRRSSFGWWLGGQRASEATNTAISITAVSLQIFP